MDLLPNSLHTCYSTKGNDNLKDYGTVFVSLARRKSGRKSLRRYYARDRALHRGARVCGRVRDV